MRRFLSVLIIVAMLLTLASCSERGAGKSVSYPLSASPSTLDPQYAAEVGAQAVINNIFEGLVRLNSSGEVIPGIAESWDISADGLTYTFKLKEGTEWYCPIILKTEYGEEFYKRFSAEKITANDFVFACRRTVMPETNSSHAHRLFAIENAQEIYSGKLGAESLGVTAQGDYTLVFRLAAPCPDFLERLTECEFMPCNEDFFNAMGGRYGLGNKYMLCNGPFYVNAWDPETSMTIKANKFYSGASKAKPSSVIFSFDPSAESISKKLTAGSLGAAFLSPDAPQPENTVTVSESVNSSFGFIFNCANALMGNKELRLALCSSIDRNLFSSKGSNIAPQSGLVPRSCSAGGVNYRESVGSQTPSIQYDAAAAATHLKSALSQLGTDKLTFTVLCPAWVEEQVRRQLQIWQQIMGIGLGVTVVTATADEISAAIAAGNYQVALTGIDSPYESAVDFLASFSDGGIFAFSGSEYSDIIKRLMGVDTDGELLSGCLTAENYLLGNAVCYPLYERSSRFVTSKDVDGIYMNGSESTICFIYAKRYD